MGRLLLLQKMTTWPISAIVRSVISWSVSALPWMRAEQGEAGIEDLLHAVLVQPVEARGLLDLGAGEDEAAALDLRAARHQGDEGFEHLAQKLGQLLARWSSGVVERRPHARRHPGHVPLGVGHDVLDDRAVEAFLVAEIILDGRQVHARALGDLPGAGALVSMGGKEIERGFRDAPPRIFALRLGAGTAAAGGLNVGHEYPEQR